MPPLDFASEFLLPAPANALMVSFLENNDRNNLMATSRQPATVWPATPELLPSYPNLVGEIDALWLDDLHNEHDILHVESESRLELNYEESQSEMSVASVIVGVSPQIDDDTFHRDDAGAEEQCEVDGIHQQDAPDWPSTPDASPHRSGTSEVVNDLFAESAGHAKDFCQSSAMIPYVACTMLVWPMLPMAPAYSAILNVAARQAFQPPFWRTTASAVEEPSAVGLRTAGAAVARENQPAVCRNKKKRRSPEDRLKQQARWDDRNRIQETRATDTAVPPKDQPLVCKKTMHRRSAEGRSKQLARWADRKSFKLAEKHDKRRLCRNAFGMLAKLVQGAPKIE